MPEKNRETEEMVPPSSIELEELQTAFSYPFQDISLLYQALTHKSFTNENPTKAYPNNERMEFLGDAILQFVISDILVESYPSLPEGQLSKFRSVLVSEKGLSELAEKINLGKFLLIGKGEILTGGRKKKSILADTFEAVIAAIYLDSKKKNAAAAVSQVITHFFADTISKAEDIFAFIDHKTDLQELVQKGKYGDLVYKLLDETGPDHQKEFLTAVYINNDEYGRGTGRSKKISEQQAAINALQKLKGDNGR